MTVASKQVQANDGKAWSPVLQQYFDQRQGNCEVDGIQAKNKGIDFVVERKDYAICDRKTNEVFRGGRTVQSTFQMEFTSKTNQEEKCELRQTLLTDSHELSLGWSLQGTRRPKYEINNTSSTPRSMFFRIQKGYVHPSGHAFWVEQGTSDVDRVLTVGHFVVNHYSVKDQETGMEMQQVPSSLTFVGEWLSTQGERGRYSVFSEKHQNQNTIWDEEEENAALYGRPATDPAEGFTNVALGRDSSATIEIEFSSK